MPQQAVVRLNGTSVNPFRNWGLERNPFPQIGKSEYAHVDYCLSVLGATPMPTEDDLFRVLKELGATPEFTALCAAHYERGKVAQFLVEFDPETE